MRATKKEEERERAELGRECDHPFLKVTRGVMFKGEHRLKYVEHVECRICGNIEVRPL